MTPKGRKAGSLEARYRSVPANVRRILYRPYGATPRCYLITRYGVTVCDPRTFDLQRALSKGYRRVVMSKAKSEFVYERVV